MDATAVSLASINAATLGLVGNNHSVTGVGGKDLRGRRSDFQDLLEEGGEASLLLERELSQEEGFSLPPAEEPETLLAYAETYQVNARALEAQPPVLGTQLDVRV